MDNAQAVVYILCALAEMSEVWPTVLSDRLREGGERVHPQIDWDGDDPVRAWLLTKDSDIVSGRISGVPEVLEFYLEWVLALGADHEAQRWAEEVRGGLELLKCPNCAERLLSEPLVGCGCGGD